MAVGPCTRQTDEILEVLSKLYVYARDVFNEPGGAVGLNA